MTTSVTIKLSSPLPKHQFKASGAIILNRAQMVLWDTIPHIPYFQKPCVFVVNYASYSTSPRQYSIRCRSQRLCYEKCKSLIQYHCLFGPCMEAAKHEMVATLTSPSQPTYTGPALKLERDLRPIFSRHLNLLIDQLGRQWPLAVDLETPHHRKFGIYSGQDCTSVHHHKQLYSKHPLQ